MGKRTWTDEQKMAIKTRDCSLLISAAAGSGKTAVLVERIVSRLLDHENHLDIDRFLVVTFTNAAAKEMKERINQALEKHLAENPGNLRLRKQILLLGNATIATLHSFCLEILRQNYYHLSLPDGLALDPHFRIVDGIEGALLQMEVLEGLLEEKYQNGDSAFFTLVEGFGGPRDDQNLQEIILKLYSFSRSQPDPNTWLKKAVAVFRANISDQTPQNLFKYLRYKIILVLEEAVALMQGAYQLALLPGAPATYSPHLEGEITCLQEILKDIQVRKELAEWDALVSFGFSSLKSCRGEVDEVLKEKIQYLRNQAKQLVQNLQQEYLGQKPAEYIADMQEMAPLMECLTTLVEEFSQNYLRRKLELNMLDFDDLEHFTLNLLGEKKEERWFPSELAQTLRQKFAEVLVDEYQDINSLQETILNLVSRNEKESPNLFMVGDVKQSIYGFRLAEPELFLEKNRLYPQKPGEKRQKIYLSKNFRSRKDIVTGINFIFRQLMTPCFGSIIYDHEQELVFGADWMEKLPEKGEGYPPEVHLLEDGDQQAGEEDISSLQREARLIGQKIGEMQKKMSIWDRDKKEYRALEFRDIVILLRSTKNTAAVFLEEFRQLGLPAYAEIGSGYFAATEVQVMLSLLKVIDNPYQDIPLAAVLYSPIVGLSVEELARLRLHCPRENYYVALSLAVRREKGPLAIVLRTFLKKLRSWRTFARRNSLVELVWLLYQETGYYDYVGALPGGKQRQANLQALLARAKQFEKTTLKGLFKFLCFLKRLVEMGNDLGTARALGENENVVRIMSIHQSKGLEFPVVFLGCLGKRFNLGDLTGDLLFDRDLGLGPVWVDAERRLKYPTLAKLIIRDKRRISTLAEEVRLLYVAMTRARDALILVGTVKSVSSEVRKWGKEVEQGKEILSNSVLLGAQCPWDWLGPCFLKHPGSSVWSSYYHDPQNISVVVQNIMVNNAENLAKVKELLPVENGQIGAEIDQKLSWQYPFANLVNLPAKLTVTEIKNRYQLLAGEQNKSQSLFSEKYWAIRPQFMQKKGLSSTEKGTALHLVMRYLVFSKADTRAQVKNQIAGMVKNELITPSQAGVINIDDIVQFIHSPLGQRICLASDLRREIPFMLALPAEEFYPAIQDSTGEMIIVQGTIDCLFREEQAYVLVDYKTDRVDDLHVLPKRYQEQMNLYARAVQTILVLPVKEKILYSFHFGEMMRL